MTNIVCLKWGNKYGPEYVNRLYQAVQRHTTRSFKFWCFTENPQGLLPEIKTLALSCTVDLESWWNKIFLFSLDNGVPVGEQILYVDLDTLVVGNIDHLFDAEQAPDIVVLKDFYKGIAKSAGNIGSGIMSWRHGQYKHIWENFVKDPAAAIQSVLPHGDQAWIESQISAWYHWQDLFPNAVVSFKMHCQHGIPSDAKIICFHGKPSIPESVTFAGRDWKWNLTPQPWVLEHWRD